MYLFKLCVIFMTAVCSNALESNNICEGNPCEIKSPDYNQEERGDSRYHRMRRSSDTDSCESVTEEETFTNEVPGTPKTNLNNILTQKIKTTRCTNEGHECHETLSILLGYTYTCRTKTSIQALNFKNDYNESITVPINVACECVRE
ncbi:uncharacterized protein LOC125242659 isoform X2 [Leguminivora glycinivorella]|uniref:uncharacterized protein LOC125242659 isoform X2 n=1 Tax=Leguminivora glycinivorella TaxID=1035111 RepID=UPI00200BED41|nr:uncharacterized protein LOC125242659 isoform X2 [Leguminivora glycinivorella]